MLLLFSVIPGRLPTGSTLGDLYAPINIQIAVCQFPLSFRELISMIGRISLDCIAARQCPWVAERFNLLEQQLQTKPTHKSSDGDLGRSHEIRGQFVPT